MKPKDIVDVLNELFKTDPGAIDALILNRVPANQALLDHPTAMCLVKNEQCDFPTIGVIGILQAITALDDELIEACYDKETKCLVGFRLRPKGC